MVTGIRESKLNARSYSSRQDNLKIDEIANYLDRKGVDFHYQGSAKRLRMVLPKASLFMRLDMVNEVMELIRAANQLPPRRLEEYLQQRS
jgi:hypothetical protein